MNINNLLSFFPHMLSRLIFKTTKKKTFTSLQKRRFSKNDHSLLKFDKTKSIFIHIPKAAGISVCRGLYGNLVGGHTSASTYRFIYSKNEFESYFKFTFVRNPWDRLFSAYSFLKKGGFNERDKLWAEKHLAKFNNFEEFVLNWVTKKNVKTYIHFIPQTKLISLPFYGTKYLDFLGYFENIDDDYNYISSRIMGSRPLKHLNKTTTNNLSYLDVYTPEMIKIIARVYAKDICNFGYNFDNSKLEQKIAMRVLK